MQSSIFRLASLETTVPIGGTLGKVDNIIFSIGALQFKGFSKVNGIQDCFQWMFISPGIIFITTINDFFALQII